MTTLILTNGERFDIKETAEKVTGEIDASVDWIRLTLIIDKLNSNRKENQCRFMIASIACWYECSEL